MSHFGPCPLGGFGRSRCSSPTIFTTHEPFAHYLYASGLVAVAPVLVSSWGRMLGLVFLWSCSTARSVALRFDGSSLSSRETKRCVKHH